MNPTLSALFPNASQDTADLNPQLSPKIVAKMDSMASTASGKAKRGVPNKTESEFGLYLEALKRKGEILRYEFEGITLRWADMRYTPDFLVFEDGFEKRKHHIDATTTTTISWRIKLIEVKGGHIWDRDIVRFKGARAYWPEFAFEMHQKKSGSWKRLH